MESINNDQNIQSNKVHHRGNQDLKVFKDQQVWIYHEVILSQPQRQHNATDPQHCSWVGHENDFANPTHPTAQTQQKPSGASD